MALCAANSSSAQSSWTEQRSGIPDCVGANGIAFGNDLFLAVFRVGNNGGGVLASSLDGLTWTTLSSVSATTEVIFLNGWFYIQGAGRLLRSVDGTDWEVTSVIAGAASPRHLTTDGTGMMAASVGPTRLYGSADLVNWASASNPPGVSTVATWSIRDIEQLNGRYYLLYNVWSTTTPSTSTALAASTADYGSTWRAEPSLASATGRIAAGNGLLLAETQDRFLAYVRGEDGANFTTYPHPTPTIGSLGFAYAGGRFFTLSSLFSSTDGISWQALAAGGVSGGTSRRYIAYGRGRYVVVGERLMGSIPTYLQEFINVLVASSPPIVAQAPQNQDVIEGENAAFAVTLSNPSITTTFQWRHNGTPIPGATSSSLTVSRITTSEAGYYDCLITNPDGPVLSGRAMLTVLPFSRAGRIVNVSVLTPLETDEKMTVGFALNGAAADRLPLVVRAGGPTLSSFGVAGAHPDPRVKLFTQSVQVAENDDWGGGSSLVDAFAQTGAFAFVSASSRDAALVALLGANTHTVEIAGASGTSGSVIAEVYDALPTTSITMAKPRLVNVSVLKRIAPSRGVTAGFVIRGETSRAVVVRAVGPTLANFGVASPQPDPRVQLYRGGAAAAVATNDNWGGGLELQAAIASVGAFELPNDSKDGVITATLAPGEYTAVVDGTGDGAVLVEVYQVP